MRQRLLRPVKKAAVALDLMPKTMNAKKVLKRFVFGKLVEMPHEVTEGMIRPVPPNVLMGDQADRTHKVIYCAATSS